MRMIPPSHRAYTYKVSVPPDPNNLAVTLETFKLHIKRTSTAEDTVLKLYLNAAINYAEGFIRRDLITRTYQTFRDFFPLPGGSEGYYVAPYNLPSGPNGVWPTATGNIGFEIRKSPLQSIEVIEYLKNAVFQTVATTVYYNTLEADYSEVLTLENQQWPTDADRRLQTIRITFKNGFGDTEANIPKDIQNAILEHATALWANRGDCDNATAKATLPAAAQATYLQNRLELM